MDIKEIVKAQRAYFETGATRSVAFRKASLLKLQSALREEEGAIAAALQRDFGKNPVETYMTETGMVLEEIRYHLKHLDGWCRPQRVRTPLAQFPAKSVVAPEPHGVTLIMSPWNYPVQLCLSPLVGAVSGGNCAVVKPSAYTPATSRVLARLLGERFDPGYITVVEGGREENSALLEEKFDYIFFTGSVAVGKVVMTAAARQLTPVTLELGGKSPVIVDESADIGLAAKRITFGKVLNAGQTCVAPDYLLIQESVRDSFIKGFEQALQEFFPGSDYTEMPVIVNENHYQRIKGLLRGEKIAVGGSFDDERRFIAPTLFADVEPSSPVMQEEIFGPLLPMLTYESLDQCVDFIRARPRPLALYLFTASKGAERKILNSCSFGGGCINDTIIHLATPYMGFGCVGDSGMGSYHGKKSFETFSHFRSIVKKSTRLDLPLRYHPYSEKKLNLIRRFMK